MIDATMRARMVDWMIEVLTNFKCDDQTFFIAVSLMEDISKIAEIPNKLMIYMELESPLCL